MIPHIDPALIDSLAPLCRKHGIRRLRVGDVEIEFGPDTAIDEKKLREFARMLDKGMPTDDEVLFHSAPGGRPLEDAE